MIQKGELQCAPENLPFGENSFWDHIRAVCLGSAAGAAVIMLLILLFTVVFVKLRQVPQSAAVPLTIAAASVGAFVGGCVAGGIARRRGILYGFYRTASVCAFVSLWYYPCPGAVGVGSLH